MCSFLSTITGSLGSLRFNLLIKFKFRFLRSSSFQSDINRTTLIVCKNYSDTWMRKLLPWPNTIYWVFQHKQPGCYPGSEPSSLRDPFSSAHISSFFLVLFVSMPFQGTRLLCESTKIEDIFSNLKMKIRLFISKSIDPPQRSYDFSCRLKHRFEYTCLITG